MELSMEQSVEQYLDYLREDYQRWSELSPRGLDDVSRKIRQQMIQQFREGVRVQPGSRYIKVITGSSVHSFIVKADGGKFRRGDILKAASWRSPATNFARGNVLENRFGSVTWSGA